MPVLYRLTTQATGIQANDQFEVVVEVRPQGQSINAYEGSLQFDPAKLRPVEVRDAGSIVSLWVERPAPSNLIFSGVTPGGFTAESGKLFSVIFSAKQSGPSVIELVNPKALLNDGQGTEAQIQSLPLQLTVAEASGRLPAFVAAPQDVERPEPFTPLVTRDSNVFNNQWFVVFATTDKGSGLDHYELIEEYQPGSIIKWLAPEHWKPVQSPFALADQSLGRFIYIRAVDRAGNEQVAVVPPARPLVWYETSWFYGILVVSILLLGGLGILQWKIKAKKHQ